MTDGDGEIYLTLNLTSCRDFIIDIIKEHVPRLSIDTLRSIISPCLVLCFTVYTQQFHSRCTWSIPCSIFQLLAIISMQERKTVFSCR